MAAPSLSQAIAVGLDVLRTVIDAATGVILAQLGSVTAESTDTDEAEWWQTVGVISMPPKATAKQAACQVVTIRRGDRDVVVASRDLRGLKLAGSLRPGETCIYGAGDGTAQGRVLIKDDGSVNIYTRASESGAGMIISATPATDTIAILNAAGNGIIIDGDSVKITAKGACLKLETGGDASLIGKGKTQVDGAGIVIGSVAVPVVNSAITGPVGIAGKPSLKVLIE